MKIGEFIKSRKVRMDAPQYVDDNPNMAGDDDWKRTATHWKCIIRRGNKQMTVYFSQGSAHTKEPTLTDILDCIASDAAGIDNASGFEDWCSEYGYDTDSRKAERTYNVCVKQAEALKRMFGEDFKTLLYDTERM
jgi:hypothetical protein